MGRSLEVNKHRNCFVTYRFGNIAVYAHNEKPRKYTSKDTSGGKPNEISEKMTETPHWRSSRQQYAERYQEDNTLTSQKSSKH